MMKMDKKIKRTGICILAWALLATQAAFGEPSYSRVASEEERARAVPVGVEGMMPISGSDVVDGTYEVEVESSSSMFRIEKAELTVQGGEIQAVLTLSGTGYQYLYMGTAEQAALSDPSKYIEHVEDEEGKYTYQIPVTALDQAIACAAFSKNKKKWYGRQILFLAESLPAKAVLVPLPDYQALRRAAKEKRIEAMRAKDEKTKESKEALSPAEAWQEPGEGFGPGGIGQGTKPAMVELDDGEYEIALDFAGGSGRSFIESPATLMVREGQAYVRLCWSSSHYDYMKMGEEIYRPVKENGRAIFELPVPVFDEPLAVVGNTTAMSTPHEIEYQLIFYQDSIRSGNMSAFVLKERNARIKIWIWPVAGGTVILCWCFIFLKEKRRTVPAGRMARETEKKEPEE